MMRDVQDFHFVKPQHLACHALLEQWGRWARGRTGQYRTQPMFRLYRPPPQWELPPYSAPVNTIEAMQVERIVSATPEPHRTALRWAYVWPWIPVSAVRQQLGLTRADLAERIHSGRAMVCNNLARR